MRIRIQEWLRDIIEAQGITATALALRAGVAPSTLLRFLNGKDNGFMPSYRTLCLVADASGHPAPDFLRPGRLGASGIRLEVKGGIGSKPEPPAHPRSEADMVPYRYASALPSRFHPEAWRPRTVIGPPSLKGDPAAFACAIPDDGLVPMFQAGTIAFGTGSSAPFERSVVLLEREDGRSAVRIVRSVDEDGMSVVTASQGLAEWVEFRSLAFVGVLKIFERA